jgi:sugar transferase (PEP-CTERM system associated)
LPSLTLDSKRPLRLKIDMDQRARSDRWLRNLFFIADIVGYPLAFCLAYWIRMGVFKPELLGAWFVFGFGAINVFCLYLFNLYEIDPQAPSRRLPLKTLGVVLIASCVIVLIAFLLGAVEFRDAIGRGVLIGTQVIFAILSAGLRLWLGRWFRYASRRMRWLVLGTEENLRPFIRDLKVSQLTGQFIFLTPEGKPLALDDSTPLGPGLSISTQGAWSDLERLALEPWTGIVACAGNHLPDALVENLLKIRLSGVRVIDLADFYEATWFKVPVHYLQRSWFALAQGFQLLHNPIGLRLKYIFDVIGAGLLLLLSSPVLLLAAIAVKLESPGPLIFQQTRVGENGKLFTVYKLRSMREDAERDGAAWATKGDPRVTRVGSFIRATRIDELPQLINVLKGEMSFIGPRPERPEFMEQLEGAIPFYNLRHILRPGVTGWAQVNYPYGASVEDALQKLQFELYYIKNYSLLLDVEIILRTIRVVLFGRGR